MVDAAFFLEAASAYGFQNAQNAGGIDVGGKFRAVEAYLDVALCREIVYLVGAHFGYDLYEAHGVAKVAEMEVELRMTFEMCDAFAKIDRTATNDAVDVVSFFDQKFGEIRSVLTCDAGDESSFHGVMEDMWVLIIMLDVSSL